MCRSLLRFMILTILLLFTAVHAEELQCGVNNNPSKISATRIVGGKDAGPGEFPHQVRLFFRGDPGPWCGGTILDESHILTAAHCVNSSKYGLVKPNDLLAYVGSRWNNSGEELVISKIAHNLFFDHKLLMCDLALIQTSKPMSFKLTPDGEGSVNRVCMPPGSMEYKLDDSFIVAGWGDTDLLQNYSTVLKQMFIYKTDDEKCKTWYGYWFHEHNEMCTMGRVTDGLHNDSPCHGDSGGPVVRVVNGLYELVGVVSRSDRCGWKQAPSIFVQVDKFLDWIERAKFRLREQEDNTISVVV